MARTRVVVYDTQIAHLFDPGENAVEFTKDVIDSIIAYAQNFTVPRGDETSGRIRQGEKPLHSMHKSTGVLRRGRYGAGGSAYNDARHAEWVHQGTPAVIVPRTAQYLAVPVPSGTLVARRRPTGRNQNVEQGLVSGRRPPRRAAMSSPDQPSGGVVLTPAVRGQQANPWLARAGDKVVAEFRAKRYYRNWARGGTRLTGGSGG